MYLQKLCTIFSLVPSLNGNSLDMLSAHWQDKMWYMTHHSFPSLFLFSIGNIILGTRFAGVGTSVNDNLFYVQRLENSQWSRQLESFSQSNYMRRFQFTEPFFPCAWTSGIQKSFLYVYVCSQTKHRTDFHLLKIAHSFVLFKCPRDTLKWGANGYQRSAKFSRKELNKC